VDFRKEFDSMSHCSLWKALSAQNVPRLYVHLLQQLYDGQVGQVQTDCKSKVFPMDRGTRQADPISPILFNAALEDLMRTLIKKWSSMKNRGIDVDGRRLTNLRFADDLLLFATSLRAASSMLGDLMGEAEKYGLEVHESKTKLLWNGHGSEPCIKETSIRQRQFEIASRGGSTMYLRRLISFEHTHDVELRNRVSKAWAKFHIYRSELTGKCYDLERRLKILKAVVQPTLLYGCTCWALTRAREHLIRTTQRVLMRKIIGTKRWMIDGELEEWVDWIIQATDETAKMMCKFDVQDWVEEAHRRRFRWAGHVARRDDGRWSRQALTWSISGSRSRGRPVTRWIDSIRKFIDTVWPSEDEAATDITFWMILAEGRQSWRTLEDDYINFVGVRTC
jgi:hypothetical protein